MCMSHGTSHYVRHHDALCDTTSDSPSVAGYVVPLGQIRTSLKTYTEGEAHWHLTDYVTLNIYRVYGPSVAPKLLHRRC